MNTSKMSESVKNINALGFTNIWSGAAYDTQRESLNNLMTKLNESINDINKFEQALSLKEKYIVTCTQISNCYNSIASCDSKTTPGKNLINYYRSVINTLEVKRSEIRQKIISILSSIDGVNVVINPPIVFDVPQTETPSVEIETNNQNYDSLAITNPNYDGKLLTPSMGRNDNGPQGCETWYDLDMSYVVSRMDTVYGIPIETWIDPNTGVKMCKKIGENQEYVMVAADAESVWGAGNDVNPNSTYHMGDIVQTSWGPGMVVDYCGLAVQKRENNQENHFDIATAWGTQSYRQAGQTYADAANAALEN